MTATARAKAGDAPSLVQQIARDQAGVVSRGQALDCGLSDEVIRGLVRCRRWQRVHRGVYATFTGPLPWLSRVWSAVLVSGDGAVVGSCCALRLYGMRLDHPASEPIHVALDQVRRVEDREGIVFHRVDRLAELVHPGRRPPVMRCEHAVLQHAAAGTVGHAIGVIADSCQQRLTTPARLALALRAKPKLRLRSDIAAVLDDVASGAYSFLEMAYLRDVERPHRLPTGARQRRVTAGRRVHYRDVFYVQLATVVELDGRLGHEHAADRRADLERDVETACEDAVTVRIGYAQVLGDPCRTASAVARLLRRRGWTGEPARCGPHCRADQAG